MSTTPNEPNAVLAEREKKRKEKLALKAEKAENARLRKEKVKEDKNKDNNKDNKKKKQPKDIDSFKNPTPLGAKKDLSEPMATAYHPASVESAWYAWWEKNVSTAVSSANKNQGYFTPPDERKGKEKYVIVIPPPNVTGSLHLGHALTNSVQDALGDDVLWVPGCDHAGIATQRVVEKKIWKEEKKTRHDYGREEFVKLVWQWKEKYGSRIYEQLRLLGSSLDWSREAFTMNEHLSAAVTECFVRFFDDGLIFRADRLVNWSCALESAISDIEVEYREINEKTWLSVPGHDQDKKYPFGVLFKMAYKVKDSNEGEEVVVATTRIETMLGDTAVAVHPDDERYTKFHGKKLVHPFVDRDVPIILDAELVKMDFGTGAVKVTPAHDPNDNAAGKRHGLEFVSIITKDGRMADNCGQFSGLMRFDARMAIVEKLKDLELYRGEEPNTMRLGICSRSNDVIEPFLCPQWWLDCKEMAVNAAEAVRNKEVEIVPSSPHESTWFQYLDNIQDWCISRQLWWGHQIPAYRVSFVDEKAEADEEWVAAVSEKEALEKASKKFGVAPSQISLERDPDVLDTWFSSALFPFSVFKWPDVRSKDYERFFPTTVLETGHDILFFWVARMVMMSQRLTGKLPFQKVLLHAMVRDAHNRKMSKSLGNVIDPIDVITGISLEDLHQKLYSGNLVLDSAEIEKAKAGQKLDYPKGIPECGTDALRFGLCSYMSQGRSINLDVNRVVSYRHFCNKLWNAARFTLAQFSKSGSNFEPLSYDNVRSAADLHVLERWLLSRLAFAASAVEKGLEDFQLAHSTEALYQFWLHEFCDVFLEAAKKLFYSASQKSIQETLYTALDVGLKLLHPFMPFITEELWQRLPRRKGEPSISIMMAPFPDTKSLNKAWGDKDAERDCDLLLTTASAIRSLRAEYLLTNKQRPALSLVCSARDDLDSFETLTNVLGSLTWCEKVDLIDCTGDDQSLPPAAPGQACIAATVSVEIRLDVAGLVDPENLIAQTTNKLKKVKSALDNLIAKMSSQVYNEKVPEEAQKNDAETKKALESQVVAYERSIVNFKALLYRKK